MLPVIGLAAVVACLLGLAFWQYMGHAAAYQAAQQWVQQELGSFETSNNNDNKNNTNESSPAGTSENASLIPLTYEATPDLQIDRNLKIKTSP